MGIWQRLRGVENRQAGAYSDAIISILQRQASGSSALPGATAALEACSGFVSRAFSSADVICSDEVKAESLDPTTLSMIGRAMIRAGEYVAVIQVDEAGRLRLAPASSYDVVGGSDPETWFYRISTGGPTRQTTFENVHSSGVVHIKYAADPAFPHRGFGPLQSAHLAGRLSAEVSTALADELSGPRGQLLPVPNADGQDPTVAELKADIKNLGGSLAFVESMADQFGTGADNQPVKRLAVQETRGRYPAGKHPSGQARIWGSPRSLWPVCFSVRRFRRDKQTRELQASVARHDRCIGKNRVCRVVGQTGHQDRVGLARIESRRHRRPGSGLPVDGRGWHGPGKSGGVGRADDHRRGLADGCCFAPTSGLAATSGAFNPCLAIGSRENVDPEPSCG